MLRILPRINSQRFFPMTRVSAFSARVTQPFKPASTMVLDDIFHSIKAPHLPQVKQTKIKLVEDMVRIEYAKFIERQSEPSHLFHLIESIPDEWSLSEKIDWFTARLSLYPAMPVITAHPTRVITNESLYLLYDIVSLLGELDHTSKKPVVIDKITTKIHHLIQHPMVPKKILTPDEESKMALYIYQQILESFPRFFNDIVEKFIAIHGGTKKQVTLLLKGAVMDSFRKVCSWVKGDGDGNPNVTADTMKHAIPAQQIALLEVYIRQIHAIVALINDTDKPEMGAELQAKGERFTRCIRDIKGRVWFDVASSEEEKLSAFKVMDDLLNKTTSHSHDAIHKMIMNLRDLIELAGFYGGLNEFVRQTTTVHQGVWKNFTQILVKHHSSIADLMKERDYNELSNEEKIGIHDLLSTNTVYFETLHLHADEFTSQTKDELGRLFLIRQNLDIFPSYIFSDTKGTINFDEARIAMHFAAHHFANLLKMRQVKNFPFNQLPLCETPEDLENFGVMLRSMLENYHMRKKIVESGFLSAVLGPSDNSKVAGIMVYGLLLRTQMIGEDILQEYKGIYKELEPVVWRWKHGFGSDMKRQFGAPRYQRHCTHQGWGALDVLAAPGAYTSFLHGMVGFPCASEFKIQEIRDLQRQNPDAYAAWINIEKQAMDEFQLFIGQESVHALLAFVTDPAIERRMNISSRAGSKKSSKPHEARAIGIVNHYLIGGDYWDIYWSIAGLANLSPELKGYLPQIYQLTLCKDILYKIIYSIAVSNNSHIWQRLFPDQPVSHEQVVSWAQEYVVGGKNELHQTLAYIDMGKYSVLKTLVSFLPDAEQKKAAELFAHPASQDVPADQLALQLMDVLGGEFALLAQDTREKLPYFQQFRQCVEQYRTAPCSESEENAVLAGRGIQLPAPVRTIAQLLSPLHHEALKTPLAESVVESQASTTRRLS